MSLGENIVALRKKRGLTQEKLAEVFEVSRQSVTKWESGESEPSIDKLIKLSKYFGVSVDELIQETQIEEKSLNKYDKESLNMIQEIIGQLNEDMFFDMRYCKVNKIRILIWLFEIVKKKYVDETGMILEKYRVETTSKLDRECHSAFLCRNDKMILNIFNEYEIGNMEITEACDKTIEKLDDKLAECDRELNVKFESAINNIYNQILAFSSMNSFDEYSENKYQEIMKRIGEYKKVVGQEDTIHRFLLFFLEEIESAIKEKNGEKMEMLFTDWLGLKNYVWSKI